MYWNSLVVICCPPVVLNRVHYIRHSFLGRARHVVHHAHHLRTGIQMFAKIALGSACLACPATALIQPAPVVVFTPSMSALPAGSAPLPGAFVPGLESFGIPSAWGAGAGLAPAEETPSAASAVGALVSAAGFIWRDNSIYSTPTLTPESAPNVLMAETEAGSVTTGNSSVPEPAGLWVFGIGFGGLAFARLSVLAGRQGTATSS
jgi:hypothetical protein